MRSPLSSRQGCRYGGFRWYRGQRHFPGLYWSSTTGGNVGFESWLEWDHAMLLDFTPQVMGLLSQPLWLFWKDERGKRISHAPDYFARLKTAGGWWWTAGR
ncbi:TnsA-like heteromeric transposase endonuclease subunit [Streptomyces hygroscopicus]|uniref:TnsA-like heteromeric transposase endonuclease subunit n=1 Tax=Streptomyces hygroscopicus TaxID=1912 RepID=UPI00363A42CB